MLSGATECEVTLQFVGKQGERATRSPLDLCTHQKHCFVYSKSKYCGGGFKCKLMWFSNPQSKVVADV